MTLAAVLYGVLLVLGVQGGCVRREATYLGYTGRHVHRRVPPTIHRRHIGRVPPTNTPREAYIGEREHSAQRDTVSP